MAEEEERWQRLIDGLRSGDQQTVEEFCTHYAEPLHQLAEKRLTGALRRRVGATDVVQSACLTFLRRAQAGEFHLPDSEELWRLLCAITLAKVREKARFHKRVKRGLDRERPVAAGAPESARGRFDPVDPKPTPAEAAEFADQFEQLMVTLDEEERSLVDLKLQQCTSLEIAARLRCSERTVRRILKRVQARLERAFEVT